MDDHETAFDFPLSLFVLLSDKLGVPTLAAAFILSFGLSSLVSMVSGIISRNLSRTYNRLNPLDQQRWNAGINRAVLGTMLAAMGLRVFLVGVPKEGTVYGNSELLAHVSAFALGFFIFELRDSLNMYLAHNVKEETLIVHHMLGVLLYFLTLSTRSYMYIACVVLIEEIHSPFTHIGWILAKQGRDNEFIWDINQYILIFVWLLFREGCDFYIWLHILSNLPYGFLGGPFIPLAYISCGLVILSIYLNPWWFGLKMQQIRKRDSKYRRIQSRGTAAQRQSPHRQERVGNSDSHSPSRTVAPNVSSTDTPPLRYRQNVHSSPDS
eukprot:gene10027-2201_t